jgi:hypothetical protein
MEFSSRLFTQSLPSVSNFFLLAFFCHPYASLDASTPFPGVPCYQVAQHTATFHADSGLIFVLGGFRPLWQGFSWRTDEVSGGMAFPCGKLFASTKFVICTPTLR